jgi:hypothetical protein
MTVLYSVRRKVHRSAGNWLLSSSPPAAPTTRCTEPAELQCYQSHDHFRLDPLLSAVIYSRKLTRKCTFSPFCHQYITYRSHTSVVRAVVMGTNCIGSTSQPAEDNKRPVNCNRNCTCVQKIEAAMELSSFTIPQVINGVTDELTRPSPLTP